jgi:hypothetical protein
MIRIWAQAFDTADEANEFLGTDMYTDESDSRLPIARCHSWNDVTNATRGMFAFALKTRQGVMVSIMEEARVVAFCLGRFTENPHDLLINKEDDVLFADESMVKGQLHTDRDIEDFYDLVKAEIAPWAGFST